MKKLLLAIVVTLSGCASVKPFLMCRVSDGKAVVQQGVMGIGVGQDLNDADPLCTGLKK